MASTSGFVLAVAATRLKLKEIIPVETNNTNVDSVADDMAALPGNLTANNSLNIDRIRTYMPRLSSA